MARGRFGQRKRKGGGRRRKGQRNGVAKKVMRKVTRMYGKPEIKALNFAIDNADVSLDGDQNHLTLCTQGISAGQRIGNQIRVIGIQWQYHVKHLGTNGTTIAVRIGMMTDRIQVQSSPPDTTAIVTIVSDPFSFRTFTSQAEGKRARWFLDKQFFLERPAGDFNSTWHSEKHIRGFKALNQVVSYNSATAGSVIKNGIWTYMMSNAANASGDIEVKGEVRVFYTDV